MRSDDWIAEFDHLIPADDELRKLVLDGSIEICPTCGEMSAYAFQDTTSYDVLDDQDPPPSFKPQSGTVAHIGTCGMHTWTCGHCDTPWMDADSPLNHPAYTHREEDDGDSDL